MTRQEDMDSFLVYVYVYTFLRNHNRKRTTYFSEDSIDKIAKRKFGNSYAVKEASYRAFTSYYESPEFINKLGKSK